MDHPLYVTEYFVNLEPKLESGGIVVIGGPVHSLDEYRNRVGEVTDYNDENGLAKLLLYEPIYYKSLVVEGIELEKICFPSIA